jgi:2-polyprenyl-3-methyl-5-hydroxy-6-metoxy-1,4-benzoquinol methylase
MNQDKHYSDFAGKYKEEIINSSDPSLWTTDILTNGPVSARMKIRINTLKKLVEEHFSREHRIFDIGCGFGRQAFLLAKQGFEVTGTDTNQEFINIANTIFAKNSLKGSFYCRDLRNHFTDEKFRQIILLEVLEHIPVSGRKNFMKLVHSYCSTNSKLIISIPKIKPTFTMSLLNFSKNFTWPLLNNIEHPYPIPSPGSVKKILNGLFDITGSVIHEETSFFICKSL